jgi:hypothetical protein
MILRLRIWSAVAVVLLGATVVAHASHAADALLKAPLKVYSHGELPLSNYSIIKRLWINMPESAFYVRTQPDSGMAISALVTEATRIGADGVVNLYCLKGGQITAQSSGWYCYGNAIKLK